MREFGFTNWVDNVSWLRYRKERLILFGPNFITHPLIWRDFIGYFTSRREISLDSYHAITPASVDICPTVVSVEKKHSQYKSFNFSALLFYMEGDQTRFVESSDGDI